MKASFLILMDRSILAKNFDLLSSLEAKNISFWYRLTANGETQVCDEGGSP